MIKGIVYKNRPLISIVVGWKYGVQDVVALVDTGFTGELKLSPKTMSELGLEITHTESVSLGDDTIISMPASLSNVAMEGFFETVNVLISNGITVIGVGLLKRFKYNLNINFNNDTLVIQK